MKEKLSKISLFVWLIPINLVIFCYNEMVYSESILKWILPLISLYILVALVYGLLWLIYRNHLKNAIATSVLVVFCAYYAYILHFYGEFRLYRFLNINPFNLLLVASIIVLLYLVYAYKHPMRTFILYLNLLILLNIAYELCRFAFIAKRPQPVSTKTTVPKNHNKYPDVYVILSDEYTSIDMLKKYHNSDNADFVQFLDSCGFVIVPNGRSSYRFTQRTLASIWNMDYLPDSLSDVRDLPGRYTVLGEMLYENKAGKWFEQHGYHVSNITSYPFSGNPAAEVFGKPSQISQEIYTRSVFSCIFAPLIEAFLVMPQEKERHQEIIRQTLLAAQQLDSPKLVFCHLYMPHGLHIFNRDGSLNLLSNHFKDTPAKYLEQVLYTNSLLKKMIRGLLQAHGDPIIVLTGDHGYRQFYIEPARSESAFGALTAFHFPSGDYSQIRPRLTSPNILRVVINQLAPGSFPLVKDTSNFYYGKNSKEIP